MSDAPALELPFPSRLSPHRADAEARHRRWLDAHAMLGSRLGAAGYTRWDVPGLASLSYPDCEPDELALATDLMGFYFLFDDQFDGPLGRRPAQVAAICDELTGVLQGRHPSHLLSPCTRAFEDLWQRITDGMSDRWRARAAYNWEWYFASHPAEAAGRLGGQPPDREGYLILRRGTAAMETVLDMVERVGRFEVAPAAFHCPQLRQLRQLAADIPSLTNDVRSYPQEASRGDVNNLVMIVQRERGCTLQEAGSAVLAEAQQMVRRFTQLTDELPRTYRELELRLDERQTAQRYADGLSAWLTGYLDWEMSTGRYRAA
ncbi:terpene cyclase [Kitasatospora sp. MAA4]|uniref:terpene synthase family protein n=1 Tax=Kitasatospora sp. MAA4 TaxID=3035093 RepID=UPI002476888E|nr:terpene cyclase [Kitasatospora sp. MAA4]